MTDQRLCLILLEAWSRFPEQTGDWPGH